MEGLPIINDLYTDLKDKGLIAIGFHTQPSIKRENVVSCSEKAKVDYLITHRGGCKDWPKPLPYGTVYNHEGTRIFAGLLFTKDQHNKMAAVARKAVEEAPDFMIGGPYQKLQELARKMTRDRSRLGTHVKKLRKLVVKDDGTSQEALEAGRMLASLEKYFKSRVQKADKTDEDEMLDITRAMRIFEKLAATFKGDELGDKAKALLDETMESYEVDYEITADKMLKSARAAFWKLPPAGSYSYNMDYTETKNKKLTATRNKITSGYQHSLETIIKKYPDTFAAHRAKKLLNDME
ncbi:hypothetical protein ACFL54_08260 [Planctomycetota bacterium]